MKKVARQVALLAGALILICVFCRFSIRNTYVNYIPAVTGADPARTLSFFGGERGTLSVGEPGERGGRVRMPIRANRPGDAWYALKDADGDTLSLRHYRVSRFLTIYDYSTGGFTGDYIVMIALTVFWIAVCCIMLRAFARAKGAAFYAYDTIYYIGFSLFSLVTGVTMLVLTVRHFIDPAGFSMLTAYSALSAAGFQFMLATLPLLTAFAVAMAVSNIALLRHERARLKNVLGLLVSVLLVAGEGLGIFLLTRDFPGAEWQWRLVRTAENVYAAAFSYFECMLAGAVICGAMAARREPEKDMDFIIILGCWFRPDGTLPPQLRGRVDRAVAFWRKQREETGKAATLIPSGGQGPDEAMPEAEAMRRYLVGQGFPEALILKEDRSRNTFQNMEYSKKLIDGAQTGAKAAFATTGYHVFRSGVWASMAGLPAEGMGAKTRWWYAPNAFMRECVGLLMNRIWQEIALLVATMALFGLMSMVLY